MLTTEYTIVSFLSDSLTNALIRSPTRKFGQKMLKINNQTFLVYKHYLLRLQTEHYKLSLYKATDFVIYSTTHLQEMYEFRLGLR